MLALQNGCKSLPNTSYCSTMTSNLVELFTYAIYMILGSVLNMLDLSEGRTGFYYRPCISSLGYRHTFHVTINTCISECKVRRRCHGVMYSSGLTSCTLVDAVDLEDFELPDTGHSACIYVDLRPHGVLDWTNQALVACDNHACAENEKCVQPTDRFAEYTCEKAECVRPPKIQFAYALSSKCDIGTRNVYMCEFGFTTRGSGDILCTENATWTQATISCHMKNWIMAFRGTPGNGVDVYDAWINGTTVTTNDVICKQFYVTNCSSHYRHPLIDSWDSLKIEKVKYSLFKNGQEAAYVTFNGSGTSYTSWFAKDLILDSSWSDITDPGQSFNFFSLKGDHPGRHFFVNVLYGGCPADQGYTVTITSDHHKCPFDYQFAYPQFLYSNSTTAMRNVDYEHADVMAIYVMQ